MSAGRSEELMTEAAFPNVEVTESGNSEISVF